MEQYIELAIQAGACEEAIAEIRACISAGSDAMDHVLAPSWAYWYAKNVSKEQWLEDIIARSIWWSYLYAKNIKRW